MLLVLWSEHFVQTAKTTKEENVLWRPVRGLSPIKKLEDYEEAKDFGIGVKTICQSPLYDKYLRDNPKLNSVPLTNQEVDEFHSDVFNSLHKHFYENLGTYIFVIRKKSYPVIQDVLDKNFLSPSKELNLIKCRNVSLKDYVRNVKLTVIKLTKRTTVSPSRAKTPTQLAINASMIPTTTPALNGMSIRNPTTMEAANPRESTNFLSIPRSVICDNPTYKQYVTDNPEYNTVSLTNQEVDELHSEIFDTLSKHFYLFLEYLLKIKSIPAVKVLLEKYNFLSSSGELELKKCRLDASESVVLRNVYFDELPEKIPVPCRPN